MQPFGATILDADGLRLSADEKAFFRDARPFGFILFARNIDNPDQVRALCDDMREAAGHDAIITIDQEGGRVQRMRAPHWREFAPPLDFVNQAGDQAEQAIYIMYRLIAHELHTAGLDSNCAPMLDLAGPETHKFLRNRCLGSDPMQVARLGRAASDAMLAGGVVPVMKHMPGHGRAALDTHFDLPCISTPMKTLSDSDFAPFRMLNDMPMGMTAHLVFDALADRRPATLSDEMIGIIRNDIGFDNLLMTDDISMKALSGTPAENARASIDAGCDVVLYCNAPLKDRVTVAEAAGEMSAQQQNRAIRAMQARKAPDDIDISSLEAQLVALLGEDIHG